MASKDSEADRLRHAIVGALNLLSATDWNTILGSLPDGSALTQRMCERLRDHLRLAIGLEPVDLSQHPEAYADGVADKWLAVTDHVQDSWQHPVRRGRQHPSRHVSRRRSPVSVMRDARVRDKAREH